MTPLLAAAALVLTLTGCNQGGADGPPPEVTMPVILQTPVRTDVEQTLSAVGTVEARESVDIQPEVSGLIESIEFAEGDRVKRGQRLFTLNSRTESAAVAQARAELQLAQSNLDRAKTLIGTKAISQQELDQLESLLAVKSAVLNAAEQALSERFIEAPFDGQVGPRKVSPGQYVHAGTSLVTLVDDLTVKVRFRVPERHLAQLRTGQTASLSVAAWPDHRFEGKVDLIDPVVDPATRTVEIRLLAANPDRRLQPGMFARVSVVVETRKDSIVIPESALVPSLDAFAVYRVADGRANLTRVTLGVRLPGQVEVLAGLDEQSQFVASGIQKLVDGMKVVQAAPDTNAPTPAP
ncbi:MAG: efflux RND transporter periplasmic adaptor subunit [Verrucomicrobia bacterium]|jgi:membrane fusion protein (multidrug efflux system)|nr:efflux RND transporter periplasmic adaptor subunit [Verrucomicrobiota bacterium]